MTEPNEPVPGDEWTVELEAEHIINAELLAALDERGMQILAEIGDLDTVHHDDGSISSVHVTVVDGKIRRTPYGAGFNRIEPKMTAAQGIAWLEAMSDAELAELRSLLIEHGLLEWADVVSTYLANRQIGAVE